MNERELFNAGYEACLRDHKLQAQQQMLRDIRQLLKDAPSHKRLAFVEQYLEEQESLLQAQPSRDRAEMRLFIATEGYSHTQVLVAQSEKELDKLCKLKGMSVYRTHIAKLRTQQQSPGERKGKVK